LKLYANQQNSKMSFSFLRKRIDDEFFFVWQEHHKKLTNENAKVQSLLALYLLQKAKIGKELCYTENGKPFLKDINGALSISHTDGLCLLAISEENIGLDCEKIDKVLDVQKMANRWFVGEEIASFASSPTPEHFFALWTKKEAYSKWTGKGLKDFSHFDVCTLNTVHFSTQTIGDYVISICAEKEFDFPNIEYITIE